MKKEIFTITFICCAFLLGISINTPNATINKSIYSLKYIESGDSLWTIATKITPQEVDIRDMVLAIKELNSIDDASKLRPGTQIKVPSIQKVQNRINFGFDMAQN